MKIRRWRYTKFAKICALPQGAPKKYSWLAIARHGGPPINLLEYVDDAHCSVTLNIINIFV